jgi:4-hydroxybenzoate polyprenyltransferase
MDQNHLLDGRDRLDFYDSSKEDWNHKRHQHSFIWRKLSSFHLTLPYQSAATIEAENQSSILISFPALWSMCRPNNFIGILMLHTLGTYLAINKSNAELLKILFHPQQIAVLLSLLLTSATSMMVNDYYDIRSGVDSHKIGKPKASPRVMKRVLGLLYAPLLLITAVIPGISARLLVLSGAILTFLYTEHLKPVTWVKTLTCALLIAISPLTSGLAALSLGVFPLSNTVFKFSIDDSLLRLVAMLLCGFFGREILMDINDMLQDQRHGIQTVPVRYGVQFAARVALVSTLLMSLICLKGTTNRRQFVLGFTGSILQTFRSIEVLWSNGRYNDTITTAVEEGKLTVLLLLASYV